MEEWLIVDGYNIIGAHEGWQGIPLEEARSRLIESLSEYQAVTGRRVILVFDAHRTPGGESHEQLGNISVRYTREHESADQLIERLVRRKRTSGYRLYVATSDYLEQRMIFGQGAYRLSARELLQEFATMKKKVARTIEEESRGGKRTLGQGLTQEILERLESLRRKK
jgi:predicted RNA-binding protein with PIN domain